MSVEPFEQSTQPASEIAEAGSDAIQSVATWHNGLEPELGRFVEQKGWRSASDVVNSYRHLERLVGGERLTLPSAEAGPEAWDPVWERLGRPKEAKGYELVAPADRAYDPATADWFRETAHRIGLTASQAQALHDGFLARIPAGATPPGGTVPVETETAVPEAALQAAWGRKFDANMNAARRAYAAFLGEEAPFHDIADAIGETALMQLLAKVGRLIGEDSITGRAGGGAGPRNPAEALAEIAKLQRAAQVDGSHPYVSKTHPEHQNLVKRMEALYTLAYGG